MFGLASAYPPPPVQNIAQSVEVTSSDPPIYNDTHKSINDINIRVLVFEKCLFLLVGSLQK